MPAARRLLAAGVAVSWLHWILALVFLIALRAGPTALWIALSGLLLVVVTVFAYRMIVRPGPDGGWGGPEPVPDDGEPPWWPGFERDFRAYDARRREPV